MRAAGLAALVLLLLASALFASVPQTISYQGYLTTSAGAPATGPVSMVFSLYSSNPARNNPVWRETQPSVTLTNGIFSTRLGSMTPITVPFDVPYWLGVKVGSDVEMSLQPLSSVPYARRAATADSLAVGASVPAIQVSGTIPANNLDLSTVVAKAGDTMAGRLNLPVDGLVVGGNQLAVVNGKVGIGKFPYDEQLELSGNLLLPSTTSTTGILKQNTSGGPISILHTYGPDNLFFGKNAGNYTMTGGSNVSIGRESLSLNTSGFDNTAVGLFSLLYNTGGYRNTAIGRESLFYNSTGLNNTANGLAALYSNTSGSANTAVGYLSLVDNKIGNENVAIGSGAGINLQTGSNNVYLGVNVSAGSSDESNVIRIGNYQHTQTYLAGTVNATKFVGDGSGLTNLTISNSNLVDLTSSQTISGSKTFSSTIVGNISGNAATATTAVNFTGMLTGDLAGTQSAASVVKIQGNPVAVTAPTMGQVLKWNGFQWVPATATWAASGSNTDITALTGLNAQNALQLSPYGTNAGNTGEARFMELAANGTNYVGLKASDNIAANTIWTLPPADGASGQVLATNGSGVLAWATPTAGTVTSVSASAPLTVSGGSVTPLISLGTVGIANGGTGATTAAAARTSLGAAASGANSDITSLSGLTTPLSIGQGGTGGTTAAAARASLGVPGLATANTFATGTQTIQTGAAATKGVVVQGAASQSANLQEWQNSTGTAVASVGATGDLATSGNIILPTTTTTAGIIKSGGYTLIHTTGTDNFFAGISAGNLAITGQGNTASGAYALYLNTAGSDNTAYGGHALFFNTTGLQNTASGSYALNRNTTGQTNTASGAYALYLNTTGSANTADGSSALTSNTTGANNTASGSSALSSNTTGSNNTSVGMFSLLSNTTAGGNTAVGSNTLQTQSFSNSNTPWDSRNTAVGYYALTSNQPTDWSNGRLNTAVGATSLYSNTTGYNNTASGNASLFSNTTGFNNTALGYQSGYTATSANANTTGSNNTFIGSNSGPGTATQLSNATAIGANALVSQSNSLVLGGTGANAVKVGIGTTTPSETLDVVGNLKVSGTVTSATPIPASSLDLSSMVANTGGTMTGALSLPADGLTVGTNELVTAGGKVGIGTATPNDQLELTGNLRLPVTTASTGIIRSGTNTLIHTYGSNNFFAGSGAGNLYTAGADNTGIGSSALYSNSTGVYNTAGGSNALYSNSKGTGNTVFGAWALAEDPVSGGNTAIGASTLFNQMFSNSFAPWYSYNTAVGYQALYSNAPTATTNGINNNALGAYALRSNTTGYNNTAVGHQAGYTATTSNANTTGSNNTFVGANSGPGTSTQLTNATAIGANALVSANNSLVLGGTGANAVKVGIGTASPSETLDVVGGNIRINDKQIYFRGSGDANHGVGWYSSSGFVSGNPDGPVLFGCGGGSLGTACSGNKMALNWDSSGNVHLSGTLDVGSAPTGSSNTLCISGANSGTIQRCGSSRRLKENIADLPFGLEAVKGLRPVTFTWKANGIADFGFIAEDVAAVQPVLAIYNDQGEPDGVKYGNMTAVLVKAIKEQQAVIDELTARIEQLEKRLGEK